MAQDKFKRKLTTIFSADVAGYSRLMGEDEAATVKTLEQYKGLHPAFEMDVYLTLDPLESVKRRKAVGGTAPEAVRVQIEQAKQIIKGA